MADGEMNYTIPDPGGERCTNSPLPNLPLSCEEDVVQVSYFEPLYEEDEDHTHELKTIFDIAVPPPVQQVVNSIHWCPTPWNIDDGYLMRGL
ncbi:hypothetical protein Hanom_Chr03g00207301 [Helianthus anomalus]